MTTNGFEFAFALDGSVPTLRPMAVAGTGTFAAGDLLTISTVGKLTKAGNTVSTVAAVMQDQRDSGDDGEFMKVAIITREQVWRASFDAATYSASIGTRTQDIADARSLDANDAANGSLIVHHVEEGMSGPNPVGYVVFTNVALSG
jgi:hypothetical protein